MKRFVKTIIELFSNETVHLTFSPPEIPKYKIFWKSKITKNSGNGISLFTEEDAKRIVNEANNMHSDYYHWYQ